jgi:cobalt/nickel transport protein
MRRSSKLGLLIVAALTAAIGGTWLWLVRGLAASAEWPGVDETVIGEIAQRAGRPEPEPLLSWVQGDLLLFMFLCAGLCAGFVLGYCARIAFVEQREPAAKQLDERAA